uniref:Uncharacterized protein n=1 Tax=Leersia perrieri TaxID=77586 RepID=A0A0D9V965_9ORYZ
MVCMSNCTTATAFLLLLECLLFVPERVRHVRQRVRAPWPTWPAMRVRPPLRVHERVADQMDGIQVPEAQEVGHVAFIFNSIDVTLRRSHSTGLLLGSILGKTPFLHNSVKTKTSGLLAVLFENWNLVPKCFSASGFLSGALMNYMLAYYIMFVAEMDKHRSALFIAVAGFILDGVCLFLLGQRIYWKPTLRVNYENFQSESYDVDPMFTATFAYTKTQLLSHRDDGFPLPRVVAFLDASFVALAVVDVILISAVRLDRLIPFAVFFAWAYVAVLLVLTDWVLRVDRRLCAADEGDLVCV